MNKISLNDYKGSMIYFHFFDTYIKLFEKGKEVIFNELYINNSSYRRCREKEQGVGPEIISKLTTYYNIKEVNNEDIDNYEILLNDLYTNIYYKNTDNYEEDLNKLETLIAENNLMSPVFKLIRLLLLLNSKKSVEQVYNENTHEYNYIKKFSSFYVGELKTILNIISLFFESTSDKCEWDHDFKNALAYQILSSKCFKDQKYIEAIFYATKANDILITDYNYKRIISVNNIVMRSLLYIGNYEECMKLSTKQIRSLESLGVIGYDLIATKSSLNLSLLGLNKYKEVLININNQEKMDLSDITSMLICEYKLNKQSFKDYYKDFIETNKFNESTLKYLNLLTYYFTHRDKKILKTLSKANISGILINILQNI